MALRYWVIVQDMALRYWVTGSGYGTALLCNGSGYRTALLGNWFRKTALMGNWFPTFGKKKFQGPFELQALENEGTTFLQNVGNRLPHDDVSHPRR